MVLQPHNLSWCIEIHGTTHCEPCETPPSHSKFSLQVVWFNLLILVCIMPSWVSKLGWGKYIATYTPVSAAYCGSNSSKQASASIVVYAGLSYC
jgi:hypothetical protein